MKTLHWKKKIAISRANDSIINLQVNLNRKSLTGLLLLFKEEFTAGECNSENFGNPYIGKINTMIDGIPNRLKNKGVSRVDYWENLQNDITIKDFFDNKFAIYLDFRTFQENDNIHGSGLKLNSSNGIQLEISREKGGSGGDFTCYLYVICDATFDVMNNNLLPIMY